MNLNYGARGDEVKKLQTALNGAGYDSGEVDGIYGSLTQGAVKKYQQANGLSATGQLDEGTYNKLFNVEQPTATTAAATQAQEPAQPTKQQQMADTYQQAYQPSAQVQQAQQYLQQQQAARPGGYSSPYSAQVQDAYNRLMNRQPFQYNINEDALYNQYKDLYMQQGKQAMMDTMGQAAALTGGYGSSYASTAGNQAYQQWLTKLNEIVPELEGRAYDRWRDAGDDLARQYQMAGDMEARDYDRYRDQLADWRDERDYAGDMYNLYYNQDYNRYGDERDYWTDRGDVERGESYKTAMAMIQAGAMPSDALLRAAGLDPADARALYGALGYGNTGSGSGGSSGSSGGTGGITGSGNTPAGGINGTGNGEETEETPRTYNARRLNGSGVVYKTTLEGNPGPIYADNSELINLTRNGKSYENASESSRREVEEAIMSGRSYDDRLNTIEDMVKRKVITERDAENLVNRYVM